MITILMILAKIATPGFLKIKKLSNNGYNVIISVHDVTNNVLTGESRSNVNMVM